MEVQYDRTVQPHSFNEGDPVLIYDQNHDKMGAGKFESMWNGPYILSHDTFGRAPKWALP